jgi:formate dehydrogenase alpha subunit
LQAVQKLSEEIHSYTIALTIDGREVITRSGATVLEAALYAEIYIPTLCHDPALKPFGACRLCLVEIEGMRGLVTACTTPAAAGMVVHTDTPRVNQTRRITMELVIANHHGECLICSKNQDCSLQSVAGYLGIDQNHFTRLRKTTRVLPVDTSHPAIDRDPNKCVLCGKCVRACREIAGSGAIDIAFRGFDAKIATFGDRPLVQSVCESCGDCVARCPTGALVAKHARQATRQVRTICPYCGVGCGIYLGVRGNEIVSVQGDMESPVNRGGLCVKGRFGADFVGHPDRLTVPLIRRQGIARDCQAEADLAEIFREATWDEALGLVADKLLQIKQAYGPNSMGVLSSAKFTNEENYAVQKFARAVLGTNNIDHCARLCHASTVAGALAAFGSGAMSNSIEDFEKSDLLFVIGSNATECHPIIGRVIRRGIASGSTKLIVADPRTIELARLSSLHMCHKPGTDVALLNAMMHVIIRDGIQDSAFIEKRTEGFDELRQAAQSYTPEAAEKITGVRAADIIEAARLFAGAKRAAVIYGMGITQHTTGTDNVKCIANLLLLTGNIGRAGTGFSPLRGQNNVQGACDMGALPNVFPGYQALNNAEARHKYELAWNCALSETPGLPVTEMINAAHDGTLKALYVLGENPMMSEPSLKHVKKAMENLEFIAVQDIFPTETALLADVLLPAAVFAEKDGTFTNTERRVQKLRKAVEPPGQALPDWQIVSSLAARMGHPFGYSGTAEIMQEVAALTPIYGGIIHDRLDRAGLQWPCTDLAHPGTPFLHKETFTRGRGKFHAVEYRPAAEDTSPGYPLILTTGRVLEHWHTGSMSRRSFVLDRLNPSGSVDIHPVDARRLGIVEGDVISLASARGKIETPAHVTEKSSPGVAFMAFHWREAPVNILTNTALDPVAKIPEFKVSAVKMVLAVLERASQDNAFLAKLAANPAEALAVYNLDPEEKAAIASGDIRKIESWTGPLNDRLKTWLVNRLAQESW